MLRSRPTNGCERPGRVRRVSRDVTLIRLSCQGRRRRREAGRGEPICEANWARSMSVGMIAFSSSQVLRTATRNACAAQVAVEIAQGLGDPAPHRIGIAADPAGDLVDAQSSRTRRNSLPPRADGAALGLPRAGQAAQASDHSSPKISMSSARVGDGGETGRRSVPDVHAVLANLL